MKTCVTGDNDFNSKKDDRLEVDESGVYGKTNSFDNRNNDADCKRNQIESGTDPLSGVQPQNQSLLGHPILLEVATVQLREDSNEILAKTIGM